MEFTDGHEPTLIDVSARTVLDLMTSAEPDVRAALEQLLAARELPRDVLLSWGNALIDHGRVADRMDQRSDPAL